MDIAGQKRPTGLGRGGHQLDLGQVGTVVLAVPQLHQPVGVDGVVAIAGGGVEPDPLHRRHGVDVALGAPEVGFQLVPGRRIAEAFQDQGEAVVAELDGPNGLADEGLEGVLEAVDPLLDVGLAVVGPGEDVSDPDGDQPAVGETLVEGMGREMAVEDLREPELDQEAQQQRDVIDPFVGQFEGGAHGRTPTRSAGKPSLYRERGRGRKIQEKEREHRNDAQTGLRYN
jgi:hypothetical protein